MHVTTRTVMAGAAAALLFAGCGGGGEDRGATSCNFQGEAICVAYDLAASDAEKIAEVKAGCAAAGGTWEACPSAALAGTCRETVGGEPFLTVRYYAGAVCSAAEGEARCGAAADPELGLETAFTAGDATCGPATDRTVACDRTAAASSCRIAAGPMAPERVAMLERACARDGVLAEECPPGAVATCVATAPSGIAVTEHHYPGADLEEARLDCEALQGTWSAG